MAEGGPDSLEKEREEIISLIETALKKGDTWYLIDPKWFKQWKKYVGYDTWDSSDKGESSANPGPIDNSAILTDDGELKENLTDEIDYNLVPEAIWNKLVQTYGVSSESDTIARKVIEQGMFVKLLKVEVYLLDLKLCRNSDHNSIISRKFSKADSLEVIIKTMREVFEIPEDTEVRLYNKYMSNTFEPLTQLETTIQDAGLFKNQVLVLEERNPDGSWPRDSGRSSLSSGGASSSKASSSSDSNALGSGYSNTSMQTRNMNSYNYDSYRSSTAPGLCGLSNLGNTCFMNSAIQCMSNVPQLTEYFRSDRWQPELNQENPLGMRGEIAKTFASLIHTMWSGKHSYTVPRDFKMAVGRFAPQFSGYQQQDSQELMAFLLDGLHEDLNRIKKKPYIELTDPDGRPDQDVAKEAWEIYLQRNDSVIVDTFHGQLKSTLVCPECNKVSVTFDPFCYLSLPLPVRKERQFEVVFVPMNPAKRPVRYKLTVPKMGSIEDMCKVLGKLAHVSPDKLSVTDMYSHRFHKIFSQTDPVAPILDRDELYVYELAHSLTEDSETMVLPFYMRQRSSSTSFSSQSNSSSHLFGLPLLVALPKQNCVFNDIYNSVLEKTRRYVRLPTEEDGEWWNESKPTVNGDTDTDMDLDTPDDGGTSVDSRAQSMKIDDEASCSKTKTRRLFTFQTVNSYGNTDLGEILDNGKPVKLSGRSYISVDWQPDVKRRFFNEEEAVAVDIDESVEAKAPARKQSIQLTHCLDLFTTTERLGEQDPWYCPQCRKHQRATKKFDLWKLPKVLVIHLKRFSYNRYWRDKLDTLVEYPTKGLQMKKWIINSEHEPAMYDLIAVSNHFGGMGGGHYTAFGLNAETSHWYNFDDTSVSSTSEESVVTKAGYVLVYKQREPKSASPYKVDSLSNGDHNSVSMDTC